MTIDRELAWSVGQKIVGLFGAPWELRSWRKRSKALVLQTAVTFGGNLTICHSCDMAINDLPHPINDI
jgi:hypothetical protein